MSLHVFGIRHHGPGCARSLCAALDALAPDIVLVEGPADAQDALGLLSHEGMRPPLALLVHALDNPHNAVFYPFAEFSPEWQALRYATRQGVAARFIDLPCAHKLALRQEEEKGKGENEDEHEAEDEHEDAHAHDDVEEDAREDIELHEDPIGLLAEAAGFADREQFWDAQVEQRRDGAGLFQGILEAMTALREQHPEPRALEAQREAYMRGAIRAAQKEGFSRIAVVCGAWHAPRLAALGPAKADAELLKGLPKLKVAATWIPWTHSRLSFRSGYGAGVDSPGWYAHVWTHGERAPVTWATLAARLLRDQDLDASSANVIETVRLAHALASLRDLAAPGLSELRDAIEAVLCGGERARLALIRKGLEIGEALGQVPEHAGQVPIARDFEQQVKRLRLKLSADKTALELDLRKEIDLDRSRLLHRLNVLAVAFGQKIAAGKGAGTFRESWQIAWKPELMVELIAANIHGNSVQVAAVTALKARAREAGLPELTAMVELAIVADLPEALDELLRELDARAAGSSDVRVQLLALEPLVRVVRYGDVRETRAEHVLPVLHGLFERVVVGLLPACAQLDADAAAQLLAALNRGHAACLLLDDAELKSDWLQALAGLMRSDAVHPLIRGRTCRLLLESKQLAEGELERLTSLALSPGVAPEQAAAFIEGLCAGEGVLLVHQEELLATLDGWLAALSDEVFNALLPLLRRAFSGLAQPERRAVAQQLKRERTPGSRRARASVELEPLEQAWAAQVVPVLAHVLGVPHE